MLTWLENDRKFAEKDNPCGYVPYILKTDDDMYININNLYKVASAHTVKMELSTANSPDLLTGFVHSGAKPYRDSRHKYYVPRHLYSKDIYPDFISGTSYLMSRYNT